MLEKKLRRVRGVKVTSANIASFQEIVAKHFITDLKNTIVCRFTSQALVSPVSNFDPEKMPPPSTTDLLLWERLYRHYPEAL